MHFDNKVVVRTDIPTQPMSSYTIVAKRLDGWMKMPLGSIDLGADHIVLDGFPVRKGHSTPISATAELLLIKRL